MNLSKRYILHLATGIALLGIHIVKAAAGPLPIEAAPAPLPAQWGAAKLLYGENFERLRAESFPAGWKYPRRDVYQRTPPAGILKVVRMQDGQKVLRLRRTGWVTLKQRPSSGQLCIAFDFRPIEGHDDGLGIVLTDHRGEVDYGWSVQTETGPSVDVRFNSGKVSALHFDNTSKVMGHIDPAPSGSGQWHHMTIIADLSENHYLLFIDGERMGERTPFHNDRWFQDADLLSFHSRNALLDNITVHYLPPPEGEPSYRLKEAMRPARPIVHAHRLGASPTLDGAVDDPVWADGFYTDRVFTAGGKQVTDPRMEMWLGFRQEYLYLATRAWYGKDGMKPQAAGGDDVRIYLDPSLGASPCLRLTYDAQGNKAQQFDKPGWMGSRNDGLAGKPWPGDWDVVTARHDDYWTAEVRIPWGDVTAHFPPGNGLGGNTQSWGLNVVRGGAYGGHRLFLSPMFENPDDDTRFNPRRFAILMGIDNNLTLPLSCHLSLPGQLYTGKNTLRVDVSRGLTVDQRNLKIRVTGEARDGTKIRHEKTFDRPDPMKPQTMNVQVSIPPGTDGGWKLGATVLPADPAKETTLGASDTRFALAVTRDTLEARTDRNYYTHETTAHLRGTWWGRDLPAASKVTVIVYAREEQGDPILQLPPIPVDTNPFIIDLPLEDLPAGAYHAQLRLVGPGNAELAQTTVPLLRRLARHNEVKIRWDNMLIVEDEPFFPVFVWSNDMVRVHELGANATRAEVGLMSEQQDKDARGFGVRYVAFCGHRQDETRSRMKGFANHPNLLAWMIEDEPKVQDGKVAQFIYDRVNAAKEFDGYHPTFVTIGPPTWVDTSALSEPVDAIGAVSYASYITYNEKNVAWTTRQTWAASNGTRANWPTLQVFYFRDNRDHPTPTELRHSTYSAIVHGANALSFWGVDGSAGFPTEDIRGLLSAPKLWPAFQKLARTVRRLSPIIVSDDPVNAVVSCDNQYVALMTRRYEGALYVWALNMRSGQEKCTLTLPVDSGRLVNQIEPGGSWPVKGGRCRLTLELLQPVVLRLQP